MMNFLFSIEFWNGVKLATDIIQSIAITVATIVGGIWALKTFGLNESIPQLESLNRGVINLRNALTNFYQEESFRNLLQMGDSDIARRSVISAQANLQEIFDSSLRIDFLKRIEWQTELIMYMHSVPDGLSSPELKEKMATVFNKVSAEILKEAQFNIPKLFRSLKERI